MNNNNKNISGELHVSGKDHILIELDANPTSVSVDFKKPHKRHRRHHNVPCNPHQDQLCAEALCVDGMFFLRIEWVVAGTREVVWSVKY